MVILPNVFRFVNGIKGITLILIINLLKAIDFFKRKATIKVNLMRRQGVFSKGETQ